MHFFQNLCLFSMMVFMLFNSHCYLRRFLILQTLPPTWLIMALLQSNICSINKAQTLGSVRITWRGSKYAHLWALFPRILNQYMWGLELKICIFQKLQLMILDDILSNIFLLYNHVPYRRGGNPCRFITIRSVVLFCSVLVQHTMPWPSYSYIYSPIKHPLTHHRVESCLVAKTCLTLCDSMHCSLPSFSPMGFPGQEYWGWLPFASPEDLPEPGIKPTSPALARWILYHWATREAHKVERVLCFLDIQYNLVFSPWREEVEEIRDS